MLTELTTNHAPNIGPISQARIDQEGLTVLRRLCERGAVLAVARDIENAVVVRESTTGETLRTAVVDRQIAQAMALRDWISCAEPDARIAKYFITNAGRKAMRELTAEEENRAVGLATSEIEKESWDAAPKRNASSRYMVTESPLLGLARRRDKNGDLFLSNEQVAAGERLRQDFELSQLGNFDQKTFRAELDRNRQDLPEGVIEARDRLRNALDELGTGLTEISVHCCCYLTGLEVTEKKMGWSSRSGKIVLRIALIRLVNHYAETGGRFAPMIG